MPSLHSGFTGWWRSSSGTRLRSPWRWLLFLYPLAMGLTLMATGEHYFFDVLLGWIYAAVVMLAWNVWERRGGRVPAGPWAPQKEDLRGI